ncbi:protein disulfide isomerase-associated 5, isoform CRA_e [Rattus norvegicus]|uniref:Protein disulfide isomerase-associated 5, isoform CRA_e n=1 Tax=Rattus norvegicus TaxID=10116 RepID=A6IRG6_RAT|nr:protein disulfide isomerase-associated 5, isoform CRA_e [Rattus norvegicus]
MANTQTLAGCGLLERTRQSSRKWCELLPSDCLCCCRLCQGQEPRPVSAGVREGLPHLPLLPLWEACRKV